MNEFLIYCAVVAMSALLCVILFIQIVLKIITKANIMDVEKKLQEWGFGDFIDNFGL